MTLPNHLSSHRASHFVIHCAGFAHAAVGSEHGTQVAGVVMAQPGCPVPGIAPNATARISSIHRQGDDGQRLPPSQADRLPAIDRAVAEGARRITVSSGRLTPTGQAEPIPAVGARDTDGDALAFSHFADSYAGSGTLAPGHEVKGAFPRARPVPLGPVCAWPIDPSGGSRESHPTQQ